MLKKVKRPEDGIINKQYEIIKHYFHNLYRTQSRVEKVQEKDESEDDDDSSYLDYLCESEDNVCMEDDEDESIRRSE